MHLMSFGRMEKQRKMKERDIGSFRSCKLKVWLYIGTHTIASFPTYALACFVNLVRMFCLVEVLNGVLVIARFRMNRQKIKPPVISVTPYARRPIRNSK